MESFLTDKVGMIADGFMESLLMVVILYISHLVSGNLLAWLSHK
ncbi:hypothetical protein ABEY61_26520 [Bacillus toyonensis]